MPFVCWPVDCRTIQICTRLNWIVIFLECVMVEVGTVGLGLIFGPVNEVEPVML